jgi:nicotinamidase-related amidase
MDALLIVDMQVGLLNGEPKHDLRGVIDRINRLAARVRERSGMVIFIQHCGGAGDDFEPQRRAGRCFPNSSRSRRRRRSEDHERSLRRHRPAGTPDRIAPDRVLVTGWATDLCVDATVRSAVSNHHNVVVVTDAHTLSDRPHLDADSVKRHHHWVWSNLITPKPVRLAATDELLP